MKEFIRHWLTKMGVQKIRDSNEGFTFACPLHDDKHPSSTISTKNGLWRCWSASCPIGYGNFPQLLSAGMGFSMRKARDIVAEVPIIIRPEDLPPLPAYKDRNRKVHLEPMNESLLGIYDSCPTYLLKRGFRKDVLRDFEIGYDEQRNMATVPVRDERGVLVGISRRACGPIHPKWMHDGFKKGQVLYNAYRTRKYRKQVVVVEGQLDCIYMHQQGFPQTVSTLSAVVTDYQVELLASLYDSVLIFFDNDDPGWIGAYYLASKLSKKTEVSVVTVYPDRESAERLDPSRLTTQEIEQALAQPMPALQYISLALRQHDGLRRKKKKELAFQARVRYK